MNLDDKDPVEEPIVEAAEGTEEISEEVLEKISSEDSGVTLITAEDQAADDEEVEEQPEDCLLYTSPSPRDRTRSRMPSSA